MCVSVLMGNVENMVMKVVEVIGVNRPAIVREIPHFGLFPAFLRKRPAFLALFRNNKNR